MLEKASFALKWETSRAKTTFPPIPGINSPPFRIKDRDKLASSMTYDDITNLTVPVEDTELQSKLRWKYMRNLYFILTQKQFEKHSFEKALYASGIFHITMEQFVMVVMNEYKFPNDLKMDAHLHWLYWSFDHERSNKIDWREIVIYYRTLQYFRFIKNRTLDLFLNLFDIYGETLEFVQIPNKHEAIIQQPKAIVSQFFYAICITEQERYQLSSYVTPFIERLSSKSISRKEFQRHLSNYNQEIQNKLLDLWSKYAWERISTDMRLQVLDETLLQHKSNAEIIISRHKLTQAIALNQRNIMKYFYKEWKMFTILSTGARVYELRKTRRKMFRFFSFWLKLSRRKSIKRKRRILAEVMGNYNIKARSFERIKLFNQNNRLLIRQVGYMHKNIRQFKLAGSFLREYHRLSLIRAYYHRWWNECVNQNNLELALNHDYYRLLKYVFLPWSKNILQKIHEERQELIVRENQLMFDRKMMEMDQNLETLHFLEDQRNERIRKKQEEMIQQEKINRLEHAKQKATMEKLRESKLLLTIQQEARRKRIRKEILRLKAQFQQEFDELTKEMIDKAKERTSAYVENPDNKLAIDLRFEAIKREFYANPTPETKEREKILSSYKNILFLYIEAKLTREEMSLFDLIPQFDKDQKGYLTYHEFFQLILSLQTNLTDNQINNIIKGIDGDRDGYIDYKELQQCLDDIKIMGVPGSPWKIYIDPIEDVICYHNFITNEKVLEYEMTDKVLRQINISNIYSEANYNTQLELKDLKIKQWDFVLKNYMVQRIQRMYYLWKARRWREKKRWKIQKKVLRKEMLKKKLIAKAIVRYFYGNKSRKKFKHELHKTIEKCYDVESQTLFYYNHVTQESSWDRPKLIQRYGDVEMPPLWIPVESSKGENNEGSEESPDSPNNHNKFDNGYSYYHIKAKRTFPAKPDGFPLCHECQHLIAYRTCNECQMNYCFGCHRKTHANPFGFFQRAKATRSQYSDPTFIEKYNNSTHTWKITEPYTCDLCKNSSLNAAFYCQNCRQKLCRRCFHRLHPKDMNPLHYFQHI